MSVYQLHEVQNIPASIEEVWDFISSPKNLKEITPDYLDFRITSNHLSEKMYPGMIIKYRVKPLLGVPMTWVTEISQVQELEFFVDEQRVGPYKIWHHQHHIKEVEGGVEMTDIVTYKVPFGFLGRLANSLFIRKKLREIFDYRRLAVTKRFGEF